MVNRKEFIKTCVAGCIGGTALTMFLQSCASTNYVAQARVVNNQIIVKKTEFVKMENSKSIQRKYILVKPDNFIFPICIYKIDKENYSALLMECTHNGCELKPEGNFLICPCHGSEFNTEGIVQNPPAIQNLKTFKIITDNENIYLEL